MQRPASSLPDVHILQHTSTKVWRNLVAEKSPHVWTQYELPSLLDLHLNVRWVQSQLYLWDFSKKQQRINSSRSKVQSFAQSSKKFIYHHLKTKSIDEPNNLVLDSAGNILYQPKQALQHVNMQWDTIFASNVLHEDPFKVLSTVWPYIQHTAQPFELPALRAEDIAMTIASRNPMAAPGMDGWPLGGRLTSSTFPISALRLLPHIFRT